VKSRYLELLGLNGSLYL